LLPELPWFGRQEQAIKRILIRIEPENTWYMRSKV